MRIPPDEDPVLKVIYGSLKSDIQFNFEHERFIASLALTLSGIDTMAYLDMPSSQEDVTKPDFVRWADRYLSIVDGKRLTGLDLYGARCGLLHQYGAVSKLSRRRECSLIAWIDKGTPPVQGPIEKGQVRMVLVSIRDLIASFFTGIDQFLPQAFADAAMRPTIEGRLRQLTQRYPYPSTSGTEEA